MLEDGQIDQNTSLIMQYGAPVSPRQVVRTTTVLAKEPPTAAVRSTRCLRHTEEPTGPAARRRPTSSRTYRCAPTRGATAKPPRDLSCSEMLRAASSQTAPGPPPGIPRRIWPERTLSGPAGSARATSRTSLPRKRGEPRRPPPRRGATVRTPRAARRASAASGLRQSWSHLGRATARAPAKPAPPEDEPS